MTVSGELCCVALPFCCVVVALPCLSQHLLYLAQHVGIYSHRLLIENEATFNVTAYGQGLDTRLVGIEV